MSRGRWTKEWEHHRDRVRMLPDEVADKLGTTPTFVRMALRAGKFPFGTAVKYPGSSRWTYFINRDRFQKWEAGQL